MGIWDEWEGHGVSLPPKNDEQMRKYLEWRDRQFAGMRDHPSPLYDDAIRYTAPEPPLPNNVLPFRPRGKG